MAKEQFHRVKPHLGADRRTVTVIGVTLHDQGLAKKLALPDTPQTEPTAPGHWTQVYHLASEAIARAYIQALIDAGAETS